MQYIHLFEDLSTQVTSLTDKQLEGIFVNILNFRMREVVNMCKSNDLEEMIATTHQMENSVLYRVVCRGRQQKGKNVAESVSSKTYSTAKCSLTCMEMLPCCQSH